MTMHLLKTPARTMNRGEWAESLKSHLAQSFATVVEVATDYRDSGRIVRMDADGWVAEWPWYELRDGVRVVCSAEDAAKELIQARSQATATSAYPK